MISIGQHKLLCGDLTQGAVRTLMGEERADVVYVDPPWGPGMLQAFATMNARGSAPHLSWPDFLRVFCDAVVEARAPRAPVFVEMGWKWAPDLDRAMEDVGLLRRRCWPITYGSKSAPRWNAITLYGPDDVALEMPDPPHGEAVTRAVLAAVVRPGKVVLDPCTGLGMTARVTHKLGGVFRGVELNPERLERTATWLRKQHA